MCIGALLNQYFLGMPTHEENYYYYYATYSDYHCVDDYFEEDKFFLHPRDRLLKQ